jgi:DNA-binding CsgD family transcriptional regulator
VLRDSTRKPKLIVCHPLTWLVGRRPSRFRRYELTGINLCVSQVCDSVRMGSHDLTTKELKVLALVARGRTADEVGYILSIEPRTVTVHLQRAASKLGVSRTEEAIAIAIRYGLILL